MHTAPTNHPSPAYFSSVLLHALVVALIAAIGLFLAPSKPETPQVFEVVAGVGDNYMATQATALGDEHGIKFDLPTPPAPTPVQPAEATPTPEPVTPAQTAPAQEPVKTLPLKPVAKPSSKSGTTSYSTFEKALRHGEIVGESQRKMHEAALKRKEIAREKALARSQGVSYQQFLKNQQTGTALGRRGGVIHGKSMDKGAGGHALTAEQIDAMQAWVAMLKSRWQEAFVPPPDFNNGWKVHVSFHVSADGTISSVHLSESTGNAAFDTAVTEALHSIHVPPPPSSRADDYDTMFSLSSDDSG